MAAPLCVFVHLFTFINITMSNTQKKHKMWNGNLQLHFTQGTCTNVRANVQRTLYADDRVLHKDDQRVERYRYILKAIFAHRHYSTLLYAHNSQYPVCTWISREPHQIDKIHCTFDLRRRQCTAQHTHTLYWIQIHETANKRTIVMRFGNFYFFLPSFLFGVQFVLFCFVRITRKEIE